MEYMDMYKRWLKFDEDTREELLNLDENEIRDRFYRDLEFGTGGLRGFIAAGTNRMNVYTVRRATQGLANYLLKSNKGDLRVALGYDCREKSDSFSREAALVLNANGIKTYIYDELKPTPMLSFALRRLEADAGIVITASHNPKEYNGYKVYWNDGGQITEEHAKRILSEINMVDYDYIKTMDFNEAREKGLYNFIPPYVEDEYIENVKSLVINKEAIREVGKNFKIIYTPLHGTGNKPVRRALREIGFENVVVVPEQEMPDGSFSTVKSPNPEEHDAFAIAIEMAKKDGGDLIIGTDPDCDRIGVVVRDYSGEFIVLTGNQTGALLTHYMLSKLRERDSMPKNPVVIKTVVTTELARKICEEFDVDLIDVLTGFKYIGEKIKEFEEDESKNYIFGFEESFGYLAGTHARDKDGVVSAALICEMAAYYKSREMSLYDGILEIYEKYGYYLEDLKSLTLKGIEGSQRISLIMDELRNNTPESIADRKVVRIKDYLNRIDRDLDNGSKTDINLPASNVMQLFLEDGSLITARPSGTEPKIKFYFAAFGNSMADVNKKIVDIEEKILNMAE